MIRRAIEVINETGPLRQIVAEFHKDIHDFTEDARFSPVIFDHMLLESPIHAVDIITHFADAPLADVVSKVKRTASGYRDVHAALIEFANGVACQFSSAYTAGGRLERYELHGEFVSVYLEGVNSGWVLQNGERSELTISDDAESDTVAQDRYFVDCVSKVPELRHRQPISKPLSRRWRYARRFSLAPTEDLRWNAGWEVDDPSPLCASITS